MRDVAVTDYDDQGIVEHCEAGWRRFCCDAIARAYFHLRALGRRAAGCGGAVRWPRDRMAKEVLRRQVAACTWVFNGTGGEFTFDQTCADVGLDPDLLRRKFVSACGLPRDINLLVRMVQSKKERSRDLSLRQDSPACGVGSGLVAAVRAVRSSDARRPGRRGAQAHAVCCYQNGHSD